MRGEWIEYETDSKKVMYVKVARTRKLPVTVLLRALGISTDEELREVLGESEALEATLEKDVTKSEWAGSYTHLRSMGRRFCFFLR